MKIKESITIKELIKQLQHAGVNQDQDVLVYIPNHGTYGVKYANRGVIELVLTDSDS